MMIPGLHLRTPQKTGRCFKTLTIRRSRNEKAISPKITISTGVYLRLLLCGRVCVSYTIPETEKRAQLPDGCFEHSAAFSKEAQLK